MAEVMKEDDEQQKDDEIIIVEDEKQLQAAKNDPEADDNDEDDEDSDDSDEKLAKSSDADDERDAIRERRRLEKQERKERRDKAIARDKLELEFLRKRNDDLERRVSAQEQRVNQFDLNQIDAQIAAARNEADMADKVIAKAVAAGNGEDVAQALKYRDEAMSRIQQLNAVKTQATTRAQTPKDSGLDEATKRYAAEFMSENSWYDPNGNNEDSLVVLAIDQALYREGFDSRTPDYWDELRRRAARRLPERFAEPADDRPTARSEQRKPRGGPAVGSGKEHAPASTRKEIYISPERKQALIDAGVWDDPVLRMKYVKRYAEYDKSNRA